MTGGPCTSKLWVCLIVLVSLVTFGVGCVLIPATDGMDFRVFYIAGLTRERLYDEAYVTTVRQQLWGESGYLPYLNPPFYALLMAPFAQLRFDTALSAWRVVGLLAALASFFLMGRMTHADRWPAYWLVAILSISSIWTMALGQNSYLLLFIVASGVYLLDKHQDTAGGMALSFLLIKPHVAVLVPVALAAMRKWQAVKGWVLGALGLYVLSAVVSGFAWPLEYMRLITAPECFGMLVSEPMRSLTGLLIRLAGSNINPMVLGIAMTGLATLVILGASRFQIRDERLRLHSMTALAIALSTIPTPYMLVYDLLLLAWPCMVVLSWARQGHPAQSQVVPAIAILLVLSFVSCLSSIEWQPVVFVMVWIAVQLWQGLNSATRSRVAM
ncbi:MAG: glycosyltransferase family 87 protein [Bacillota bacterium]|nr:glycosyltransferase family 87 protein [Bacillota bacterium]